MSQNPAREHILRVNNEKGDINNDSRDRFI